MASTDLSSPQVPASRRGLFQLAAGAAFLTGGASAATVAPSGDPVVFAPPPATDAVTPFRVAVPQAALDDLNQRLSRTRYPDREPVGDWRQGVPLTRAQALVANWRDHYDWRGFERRINAIPQFRTKIDGLGIHFLHVRSPHATALPMILTHGWPGSFIEFLGVIGPLTDPTRYGGSASDAFHVVIPSLPGFGFSDKPAETGWDVTRTAKAWAALMSRLGYSKWVAQGGDWGTGVTHALAHLRPSGLVAAHVNWPLVFPDKEPENPTLQEKAAYASAAKFSGDQFGYFHEQMTRPQTIGYGLADSPVGQATWIYEKFQAWTDNHGLAEDALSTEAMLDNISLYWLTDTAASSARFYWENAQAGAAGFNAGRIDLPMAASIFPHEIYQPPKAWAQAHWPNLIYWNELDRGGHFAAFEQPALFAEELRKAFRTVRS
jgi:epoxide hydrolase